MERLKGFRRRARNRAFKEKGSPRKETSLNLGNVCTSKVQYVVVGNFLVLLEQTIFVLMTE